MNDFVPCVCHKGIMWDAEDLTAEGHCPQYFWEQNDSSHQEASEMQAAYDETWG